MPDKKEIPPVGRSNNHGGFCFKGNIVDLFCGIYWFSWVELQRIVKIRNRHHQGLIWMCHCMCNIKYSIGIFISVCASIKMFNIF